MKTYNIIIQDIYEKGKYKEITIKAINPQLAHKAGLKHTNALREEISLIKDSKDSIVFTYKEGFKDINE